MSLTAVITILYMVVVLVIGFLTSRKKGGVQEFFIAGGQLHWILLTPLLMAEYISSGNTVGIAEKAHQSGISILWYYIGSPVGLALLAFTFAKFYKQIKKITLGEVYALLFDRKTRLAAVVTLIAMYTFSNGTASLALATVVAPMFGLSYESGIWLSAGFMVLLALMGLRGQAWMNIIHIGAILVTFVIVGVASVVGVGGLGKITASVPPAHLSMVGEGWLASAAWVVHSIIIKFIALNAVVAMFAARDERSAKMSAVLTGVLVILFSLLPAAIGLSAYVVDPGMESRHALWKMSEHLGEWATIMSSIGVIAAIVSTTPAMFLNLGALFTRDIFLPLKSESSDKVQVMVCRIVVVVLGFLGTWVAFSATGTTSPILKFSLETGQVRTTLVVPLLVSVFWRRVDPTVAFWTVVAGVGSGLIWLFSNSPFGIQPLWVALGMTFATLIVGSLVKKPSLYKGVEGLELATDDSK